MYDFDKGDLFIEISDPGDKFIFDDEVKNIYISVGGILRLQITKSDDLMANYFTFFSADGTTMVSHIEIIDPETIGDDNE